jgi:hypothetical protein
MNSENTKMIIGIKATVMFELKYWSVVFERIDGKKFSVAKAIFGKEPTNPEIYEYVIDNFCNLNFSQPVEFNVVITRKNPKRLQREIKKEMEKIKDVTKKETYAQEVLRVEMEKNKIVKKKNDKAIQEQIKEQKYIQKLQKKKEKLKGH